jgi:hypothetical protein
LPPLARAAKYLGIAVAVFVLSFFALLAFRWPFTESAVRQSLDETFPAKVSFQKFQRVYFPHPGCIAEGVAFRWLATPNARPIVTIRRFQIQANYWDLLLRPGYLSRILLDGFSLDAPRIGTPREKYDWEETPSRVRVGAIQADGAEIKIAREDPDAPLIFRVHSVRLTSVSRNQPLHYGVALTNALPPGEIAAQGDFGPWNSGDPGATPVQGTYSFRDADLGVFEGIAGKLSSGGDFQGALRSLEANGTIDIPDFSVTHSHHAIHVKNVFHAFIDGTNGDVTLERVTSDFLRTHIVASGKIAGEPGGKGKTATIDLRAANGRVQDLLRMFTRENPPPFTGVTSYRARVVIPPGKEPFLDKVRLSGDFGIAGGEFTKSDTQEQVNDLSVRASGKKPPEKKLEKSAKGDSGKESGKEAPAKEDANEEAEDQDNVVSNLSGHVELRQQIATFNEVSFNVTGASANMHGTYQLDTRKIDLHGILKTEAEFSNLSSGFKSVLLKPFNAIFKKKHAGAVVPVHLTGTYEHPETGIDLLPNGKPAPLPPVSAPAGAKP